ncbi:ferrochelatase [Magnetospira sp. QH-2]|uniref:ferrochelatase n=1 Tax=Magnetospira sp. (strain QH-2) TaxID=1288970 RepID=UPI0003E8142D|nr:ferrochelatase [Magnetospira sp. QH-2]CCQ75620.1 Ferrochelatase [Magnetospira sp. QH-2]
MAKLAVVLFNLGGPDRVESIRPFLFNLFNDPAIITAPGPIRWLLAQYISRKRAPVAAEIYQHLGGKSPLLDLTWDQANALRDVLSSEHEVQTFIAMRYWHPMSDEVAYEVKDFDPDEVILLPLYPQFSTTTVGSSIDDWNRAAKAAGLDKPTHSICCYPLQSGWIEAVTELTRKGLQEAESKGKPRLLFSAHGLPKKIVDAGDPYQWQVEQTSAAVVEALGIDDLDWAVCYQSRVGRLEWIGPSTEQELQRAGNDGVPAVIVPIAFVSEHSETLVELDIEYREEADKLGVPGYVRVPAVGTHPAFIGGLADLVGQIRTGDSPPRGTRICAANLGQCPCGKGD